MFYFTLAHQRQDEDSYYREIKWYLSRYMIPPTNHNVVAPLILVSIATRTVYCSHIIILYEILYIYGPCCREIWRFVYSKKSYFSRAKPQWNMTSEGKQSFISPYNKGHKLFIIPKLHTQQQNIF